MSLGWSLTLITGGIYCAQALLIGYTIQAFFTSNIAEMRSRANLLALCWLIVAIVEFFGHALYWWSFGYSAERMARPPSSSLIK